MRSDRKKMVLAALGLLGAVAVYSPIGTAGLVTAAHATSGCSAGDLVGTYAVVLHGTDPAGLPIGAIATFTSDGAGNLDGFRVDVDDGVYGTSGFTCTYTMSAACLLPRPLCR